MAKATPKSLDDAIIKEYGDVIQGISYLDTQRQNVIPTTPKLDLILNGGIPEGSFVTITGKSGIGKSSLALKIASEAQKIPNVRGEKRKVIYSDVEARVKPSHLKNTRGLDLGEDVFKMIRSTEGKILDAEDFLDINKKYIHSSEYNGAVFIIDSFSSLCSNERYNNSDGKKRIRDNVPLLLSDFTKTIAQAIPINNVIVIGITHLIANQSGMGRKLWLEASGEKIKYQSDVKLKATHFTFWQPSVDEDPIGQQIHWECEKSALGPPGKKIDTWLRYGLGFDEVQETLDLAVGCNVIKKAGAWMKLTLPEGFEDLGPTDGDNKGLLVVQGNEKMRAILEGNEKLLQAVINEVKSNYLG